MRFTTLVTLHFVQQFVARLLEYTIGFTSDITGTKQYKNRVVYFNNISCKGFGYGCRVGASDAVNVTVSSNTMICGLYDIS